MSENVPVQPAETYAADLADHPFFVKDEKNYINILSKDQLSALQNMSLLDIFLSRHQMIEPHYHPNATELIYCVSGSVTVSLLGLESKKFHHYRITKGQAVSVPQGFWHYFIAEADGTHVQGIFDAGKPQTGFGSDLLALTPKDVMPYAYGMDAAAWEAAVRPVKPGVIIGPPA
ncbi:MULTISPECIES: cupin domain-containing protein [Sporosarcina]|uniref:cupin domain-containing protein n=1 Tax=Sporosarcina TaxID=1569 RepID=UPI00069476B0|nr:MULTISPECIES: cupin domain-containing protein [Sporosarcina]WJY27252.1 cupin domain-containing protein [Sporosarcina sp. 0.2-SM1T-5]